RGHDMRNNLTNSSQRAAIVREESAMPENTVLKNASPGNFLRKALMLAPLAGAMLLSLGSSVTATPATTMQGYRLDEVQWVWLKAELDADGKLTREEVLEEDADLAARFDEADLDGDGTLSAGEFEILLMSS